MNGDYKSMTTFFIPSFSRVVSWSSANLLIARHVHSIVNFLSDICGSVAVVNEALSCLFQNGSCLSTYDIVSKPLWGFVR